VFVGARIQRATLKEQFRDGVRFAHTSVLSNPILASRSKIATDLVALAAVGCVALRRDGGSVTPPTEVSC
jgi:hypothetical protein